MTTTTSSAATNAFLRALAHSKSVDKQARLVEEMMCSFSSTKGVKVDDEDQALFLDLRPREKYRCHSLLHSVNIPFSEISGSFHLLPPREVPFAVLLDEEEKEETKDEDGNIIHRGISKRMFSKSFTIANDVEVKGAELKDGLLKVSMERIIPEHKKAKSIAIK